MYPASVTLHLIETHVVKGKPHSQQIQYILYVLTQPIPTRIGCDTRFANGPGNQGSIPDRIIPKIQKTVLNTSLLNTQHYKVGIKGKVGLARESSSALNYTSA